MSICFIYYIFIKLNYNETKPTRKNIVKKNRV